MPPLALDIGLSEVLENDSRPTFVVELPKSEGAHAGSSSARIAGQVAYENPALVSDAALARHLAALPHNPTDAPFWQWIIGHPGGKRPNGDMPDSLAWQHHFWTKTTLRKRWVIVAANAPPPLPDTPRKRRLNQVRDEPLMGFESPPPEHQADNRDLILAPAEIVGPMLPDFTSESQLFLDVIHSVDWEHNTLGPMNSWPMRLDLAFNQIIPDSRAIAIYWGPKFIAVYNEAFSKFCGIHHPQLLGQPVANTWPHLKDHLTQIMSSVKYFKIEDESRFFVEKPDHTSEETYVKWSLSPIIENRICLGIHHSLLETTSTRLWERRMKFLIDLGNTLVTARDVKSYWARTLEEFERWSPSYDVPLAFVYSMDGDTQSPRPELGTAPTCHLEGALGVPKDHPIAPSKLDLRHMDDGLADAFRKVLHTTSPLLLQVKDGTLPERLLHGLEWRGFGDQCQAGIVCPIRATNEEAVMGVLFLGLNPRRPYDDDYRQFISLLNQKLTSSLASTVLLDKEARWGQNVAQQAAYERAMLQKKLEYQTEQATKSIQTFRAVSGFIPVGMSIGDGKGNVTFANDAWYRITGYPKGPIAPDALLQCVLEEDKTKIVRAYDAIKIADVVTFEFRIPRKEGETENDTLPVRLGADADGVVGRHVLASAKAERGPDGSVVRILTCLTDVTAQKHTAEEAIRRAQESENLKRLAEFATVGMYDISLDGRLLSANNLFWEFSGLPKVDLRTTVVEPWQSCVVEEDLPLLWKSLEKLKKKGKPQTAEIRLKTMWREEDSSGNAITAPRWVTATFMPVKSSEGVIQSFTGCLSDVSLQKWQLEQEKLRKEEAIESKRQQENFIDMTSHEMRNPLSAMLHCTDAIIASLSRIQDIRGESKRLRSPHINGNRGSPQDPEGDSGEESKLLITSIEDAETIIACAQHQRRIVDDILTMSKLDSKLLTVTPCTVNPIEIVRDAVKMFEVEARRVDIALTYVVDDSYSDLGYEFLDLDPSRVKQVLINLLTNALKFTKTGKIRNVDICMKGCLEPPRGKMAAVDFIPRFCDPADEYEQPALKGRENPVYLLFEVRDTGQGLTAKEMGNLFNKFVQASAKTHVKYGGSGLGLFISRRLTELQNGAIGVASQAGLGSTFAFYIEAYVPSDAALREAEAGAAAALVAAGADLKNSKDNMNLLSGHTLELAQKLETNGIGAQLDGILIVEDNLINQLVTRRGLSEKGYAVDIANHGIEALEKLRKSAAAVSRAPSVALESGASDPEADTRRVPINLVLMDVEMPVQDGLTCTRHIRELERKGEVFCASGGSIPIIAVTANARAEQINEARMAGCDDVLVKPYRIPQLIEKMKLVVNARNLLVEDESN